MVSIRRSLALSVIERNGAALIQLVAMVVLARLLTPSEFGVFAFGAAVLSLAHTLRDFGVVQYLIQERELTPSRIGTALGLSVLIAWSLAAALFALSEPLAGYFEQDGLDSVFRILSIGFLALPLSTPAQALLRRHFDFDKLLAVGLAGATVQAGTSIVLALLGFSYLSLAWGAVAGIVATALFTVYYRPDVLRINPSLLEWRRVASFGFLYTIIGLLGEIGSSGPNIVVGKILGVEALGIFSRGRNVLLKFNQIYVTAIQRVALPGFSRSIRKDQNVRDSYLTSITHLSCVIWSFLGLLGLFAFPLVRLLLGDQWDDAVPVIQVLCITGLTQPFNRLNPSLFIALGKIRAHLRIHLVVQPIRLILVVLAAQHSLMAVAWVLLVPPLVNTVLGYRVLSRTLDFGVRDLLFSVRSSLLVSGVTLCLPAVVYSLIDIDASNHLWFMFCVGPLSVIIWISSLFLFGHPLGAEVRRAWGKARSRLSSKT